MKGLCDHHTNTNFSNLWFHLWTLMTTKIRKKSLCSCFFFFFFCLYKLQDTEHFTTDMWRPDHQKYHLSRKLVTLIHTKKKQNWNFTVITKKKKKKVINVKTNHQDFAQIMYSFSSEFDLVLYTTSPSVSYCHSQASPSIYYSFVTFQSFVWIYLQGSSTSKQHVIYVWDHFLAKSPVESVAFVAHSYGGVSTLNLVSILFPILIHFLKVFLIAVHTFFVLSVKYH